MSYVDKKLNEKANLIFVLEFDGPKIPKLPKSLTQLDVQIQQCQ